MSCISNFAQFSVRKSISSRMCFRNSLSLFRPDHILLHILPDTGMQPLDGDQIHLSPREVFQVKGEVHEVPEGRLLELHQDVDVAGRFLLAASERAKKTDPLYCKAGLNVIGVASEKIDYFHVLSITKVFKR